MEKLTNMKQLYKYMPKHEVYYNVNISLKNRYIYFETAKAACTTIKRTLMNLELCDTNYKPKKVHLDVFSTPFVKIFQLDSNEVLKILDSDSFYKFCFVRNPFVRVLSSYLDKIEGNKPQKTKILQIMGINENEIGIKIEFEDFVNSIEKQKPREMDQHWRPQFYQLFGGIIRFDYIGRVESLNEDLYNIEKLSGCDLLKYHENVFWHKTDSKSKITQYYNSKIANKILQIYACDFKQYNYSMDWKSL